MKRILAITVVFLVAFVASISAQEVTAPISQGSQEFLNVLKGQSLQFNILSILRGAVGMAMLVGIAWLFSTDRKHINWATVLKALALQFIIAVSVIAFPAVQAGFEFVGSGFIAVLAWTQEGTQFLFGPLMGDEIGYIFAFRVLPTIIFFSALTSLLYYLGVLQKVVWVMGWVFSKFMGLSGPESLSCAGNIFLGQTSASYGEGLYSDDDTLGDYAYHGVGTIDNGRKCSWCIYRNVGWRRSCVGARVCEASTFGIGNGSSRCHSFCKDPQTSNRGG